MVQLVVAIIFDDELHCRVLGIIQCAVLQYLDDHKKQIHLLYMVIKNLYKNSFRMDVVKTTMCM